MFIFSLKLLTFAPIPLHCIQVVIIVHWKRLCKMPHNIFGHAQKRAYLRAVHIENKIFSTHKGNTMSKIFWQFMYKKMYLFFCILWKRIYFSSCHQQDYYFSLDYQIILQNFHDDPLLFQNQIELSARTFDLFKVLTL